MSKLLEQINMEKTGHQISDFVEIKYGFGLPERDRVKGAIPVYASSGLVGFHNESKVKKPAIIIGRKGNVGSLSYSETESYPIDTVFFVDEVAEGFDLKYVYYLLQRINLPRYGGDSAVPGLSRDTVYSISVDTPTEITQKKIASILSVYDAKIENNNLIIKELEAMAQTLFSEWFVSLRFQGYENVKFVDSEIGEIPEEWSFGSVLEIFDVNPQTKVINTTDVPYVEMRDLSESNMTFMFDQKRKPVAGSRFKNHDTLVARITPCLENGKTGYVNCLADAEVGVGSTEFLVFRPKEVEFREFTYLLARSAIFRSFAIGRMIGSSGRQRVSGDDIAMYQFLKPNASVIKEFHRIAAPMFDLIKLCANENETLKSNKDLLLATLI